MPRAAGSPTGRSPLFTQLQNDRYLASPLRDEIVLPRTARRWLSSERTGLAAAPHGAIAGERPRAKAQARAKRRRNILERRTAVAAGFLGGSGLYAKPLTTGRAFGIQALHGPAWQILHRPSLSGKSAAENELSSHPTGTTPKTLKPGGNFATRTLVCQWESDTISRVQLAGCGKKTQDRQAVDVRRDPSVALLPLGWTILIGSSLLGRFLFGEGVQLGLQVENFLLRGSHVELLGVDL